VRPADDANELTAVAQDYLKVIWNAQEWSLEKVSTKMLAEKLGVSASTASESIRKLAEQGLVDHEKYGAVTLTESGAGGVGDGATPPAPGGLPGQRARLQLGRSARRGRGARARVSDRLVARMTPSWVIRSGSMATDPRLRRASAYAAARQLWACDDGDAGTVARISDKDPRCCAISTASASASTRGCGY